MRWAPGVMVLCAAATARADSAWEQSAEAGVEYDTNVQRIEVDPDGAMTPIAAPAARAGGKFLGTGERGRGRWTVAGQALARLVAYEGDLGENVGVIAGEAQWDRRTAERAAVGVRASYYDVLPLLGGGASRAFAIGAVDGLVVLGGEGGERFALSAGVRDFRYKPDDDFDWRGIAAALRFVSPLGRGLDLSAGYRLERRSFAGRSFTSGCGPMEPALPTCFVPTGIARSDLHHVGELELIYTGDVVASTAYQGTFNDSSSYGQSLVRHRMTASVTAELPARVFATAIATLQLDQYLDPLVLARDVSNQTFTSIEEENRSALSVRLSRRLGGAWAAEARWAFYADSLSEDDLEFRRHLLYGGITWASE